MLVLRYRILLIILSGDTHVKHEHLYTPAGCPRQVMHSRVSGHHMAALPLCDSLGFFYLPVKLRSKLGKNKGRCL